jgi:Coenzyme PQQ synthesis protein D (PqqD)
MILNISSDARWYQEGDELVLLSLDSGRYFGVNNSGIDIWTAIAKGASEDECAALLRSKYGISEDLAKRDVRHFVQTLTEVGLLS